ncbi:carbon-nitrogen hydrolase family protein [Zobellella aerophila]|uniref:Carbon-nitrogen hydrolase family protein n=1 Tax=Zobellella aerophila TaxID=870480 RepID=A0ABP6VDW3_9GAMM
MSTTLAVSLAQIEVIPLDADANGAKLEAIARREAAAGARLIVFPELCNTGYIEPLAPGQPFTDPGLSHADYGHRLYQSATTLEGELIQRLIRVAVEYDCHLVTGLALRHPELTGALLNASVLIGPGGVCSIYAKAHLWHNEKLYFVPGQRFPVCQTPIGRIGMQVCYDIRFPEVTRSLALAGAELVTNVWASFRELDRPPTDPLLFHHRAFTRAQENGLYFLSCNRVGEHGGYRFMGRSLVAAPDGTIIGALDHEEEDCLRVEIKLDEIERYRMATGIFTDRRPALYQALNRPADGPTG